MSTKLGTLTLDLVTRTAGFTAPIKTAEKQTVTSFDAMKKSVLTYGAIAVSGATAVGAGVLAMAREYANAARELQTFASISNTTTQEFQRMAVGAETMGISSEKLSDQLKDFNEKLGEFITIGSGGAVDFFEQIAIKTEGSAEGARKLALEMQNLSGPKALQLYVDKLEEAGVTQQQMSFYLESMASDTTNLIPLLKDGGEGFKFWADAAERAGVIMDESAIQKANELSVQMDLLNLQVKGAKNQFIQGLMPALVSVGDSLTDATTDTNLLSDAGATLGNVFIGVAATGMGVYAVVKMLSNAIAGLAFDAVNAKKMVDKAAEGGSWTENLPGVKFTKALILGTANARFNESSGVQMAAQDNAKLADDIGTSIREMFTNTVNESVAAMSELRSGQQGVISGSDEWIKKQNEAAKAAAGTNKALLEQNRILEQQKRDREQIIKAYSTDFENINSSESEELGRILGARFTSADQSKFTELAKMRFDAERAEYFKSLSLELNEYKWSEQKKLEYAYQQDREIAENSTKFSGVVKEAKLKFLDEQYAYQKKQLEINQAKELLQTKQLWMSASEYAEQYYALVREEILNTASYSPETKDAMIKQANMQQGMEQNAERENIWADYQYRFEPESQYQRDIDLLKDARDQMLITEEEYQRDRIALQAGYGAEYLNSLSGFFGSMLGKSSSAYQALFFAQKSFYLAQAGMNVWKSASDAYANEPGTVWQKMGAAALATLESGSFLSLIEAATPMGMAHDGIDNIPKEGTWLLDKGERVVDSRTNSDLKNYLANKDSGGGDVNIQVHVTDSGVSTQSNQADQKQLGQMIGSAVRAIIRQEQRQGGLLAR